MQDWAFIPLSTRAGLVMISHLPPYSPVPRELRGGDRPSKSEPLAPCSQPQGGASGDSPAAPPAYAWGVEVATSFSKQDALDQFARVKQAHADLLGSYDPMVVESCDLPMGTDLQSSVRVGTDSRDDADKLCAKLQAVGGACIVQKN